MTITLSGIEEVRGVVKPVAPEADAPDADATEGTMMAETLTGDIRDRLLSRLRGMAKPFAALSEAEQAIEINACEMMAMTIIARTIEIVHAEGAPSLRMTVKGVSFKKEMAVALSGDFRDPQRHLLADQVGGDVLVTIIDPARFDGERAPARPDPDQQSLLNDAAAGDDGEAVFDQTKTGERMAADAKPKGRTRKKQGSA